ncbi:MAG: ATP-dependent DNA helicase RecG [Eubacteriales bacterium]|nr:ATP-dependent DNA helicase RecG [Eubacteriales bacterium]
MEQANSTFSGIPGISAKRRQLLHKLGIYSTGDLVGFFPRGYEDWRNSGSADLNSDEPVSFRAYIDSEPVLRHKGKMSILKVTLRDESGTRIFSTWFNQPYFQDRLIKGNAYIFRGKIRRNGISAEIVNPSFESTESDDRVVIKPVYPLTSGLTQGVIRKLVWTALEIELPQINDCLPDWIRSKYKLCSSVYAYEKIHLPKDVEEFEIARRRLAFEELFMIQAGLKLVKSNLALNSNAWSINPPKGAIEGFCRSLPFDLTKSQTEVISEIMKDMSGDIPMSRLVQGDVGSGKTVISAAAIAACMYSGHQSALMAPTSVLANQHYNTFLKFFPDDNEKIALLTGSVTGRKRKDILERLENGSISLLIGTHAVISDNVRFRDLALAVTDEQHRFGVDQRSRLGKGEDKVAHVLVMSATPIPRTLGFVLYGDLDISVVKGLPGGRKPVETYTSTSRDDPRVYALIYKHINEGRQAYIVCPMIEATMESDLLSVKELYEELKGRVFRDVSVGLLHGAMKSTEKDETMRSFMNGDIKILVSTTVIEVGVDNPNATIMLVQNAERFGLAQLHQLRGRIGRGSHRSICILKSDADQQQAKERLKILCRSSDGFVIAEKDLQMRGTGDFFGTRQHGIPDLKIANLYTDTDLLEESRAALNEMFSQDPLLGKIENRSILPHVKQRFGGLIESIGL